MRVEADQANRPPQLFTKASSALCGQNTGADKHQHHASVLDTRQIVRQSVVATDRSWQARDHYIYMERDEDRRIDSLGQLKSENADVTRMMLVNGGRFEQLMEQTTGIWV